MSKKIVVDCQFAADGTIRLRRLSVDGQSLPVEQGRQWVDDEGRHLLIMLRGSDVCRLTLKRETLIWELKERRGSRVA